MKIVLSFSVCMLCIVFGHSQTIDPVKTNTNDLRLYAGFNLTMLTNDQNSTEIDSIDHTTSYSGRPGFELGLAMTFGNRLYVQPGIKFSQISTELINENTTEKTQYEDLSTVNVLTVPLRVGFRLINQETEDFLNVRVYAGLQGLFVLGVNHNQKSEKINDLDKNDFQDVVFNGEIGAGLDLWIFYLGMGLQLGLTPLFANTEKDIKANSFYSNLGVRFKF